MLEAVKFLVLLCLISMASALDHTHIAVAAFAAWETAFQASNNQPF